MGKWVSGSVGAWVRGCVVRGWVGGWVGGDETHHANLVPDLQ